MAVARIEVEFDDQGAVTRVQRLTGETVKANAAQRVAATQLRQEMHQANNAAQLLGGTLGVHLPREVNKFLGQSKLIGPALSLAFNVSILTAFAVGLAALIPRADEWLDKLRGIETATADVFSEVAKVNEALGAWGKPGSTEAMQGELRDVSTQISRVKEHIKSLKLEILGPVGGPAASFLFNRQEIALLQKELEQLSARQKELGGAIPIKEFDAQTKAIEKAVEATKEWNRQTLLAIAETRQGMWDAAEKATKEREKAEKDATEALAKGWSDFKEDSKAADAQADQEAQARLQRWAGFKLEEIKQVREVAEEHTRAFENMAQSIEGFLDRVFLTTRSWGDAFKQLWMQIARSVLSSVARMIAGLFFGGGQGASPASAGAGGMLGSVLGIGGLGLGAGTGGLGGIPGVTPTFPSGGGGAGGMLGALGIGGAGAPTAAGGATQGLGGALSFGGLRGLAEQWASMGPLAKLGAGAGVIGGATLIGQGFGQGSILKGALGGAALGATSALMAGLLFTPYGAIAAGIYAAVGALIGWMGKGRAKRKAANMEQEFEFAANELYAQYKQREVDYESALAGMKSLIEQGREKLLNAGLGDAGRRGAANLTSVIEAEIRALGDLHAQRENRRWTAISGAIPEFAVGGPVGGFRSGILALLHPGEFVMRREAVDSLGTNFLAALNRLPQFAGGGEVGSRQSAVGSRTINAPIYILGSGNPAATANAVARRLNQKLMDNGEAPLF